MAILPEGTLIAVRRWQKTIEIRDSPLMTIWVFEKVGRAKNGWFRYRQEIHCSKVVKSTGKTYGSHYQALSKGELDSLRTGVVYRPPPNDAA